MNWKVKMLDFNHQSRRMINVSREDKALLRSNLSVWLMPGDGQEYMSCHMLLPFRLSSGYKAVNLLSWCRALTKAKNIITLTTGETYVRILNPIKILKSLYFHKKLTFFRTRYRQNQHLWRHFGDKMSLENCGVFQFMKEVTFRGILAFYNL